MNSLNEKNTNIMRLQILFLLANRLSNKKIVPSTITVGEPNYPENEEIKNKTYGKAFSSPEELLELKRQYAVAITNKDSLKPSKTSDETPYVREQKQESGQNYCTIMDLSNYQGIDFNYNGLPDEEIPLFQTYGCGGSGSRNHHHRSRVR